MRTTRQDFQNEIRLREEAISRSVVPVAIGDANHVVTFCNKAFLDLFAVPSADMVLGRRNVDIFKTQPTTIEEINEAMAQDGSWTGEVTCQRFNGSSLQSLPPDH